MSTLSELYSKLAEIASENEFDNNGIIRDPGKFEGEGIATLYFYDAYINGGGTVAELTEEEKRVLDIDYKYVYLAESNDGFVSLEFYDNEEDANARDSEGSEDYDDDEDDEGTEYPECPMCGTVNGPMGALGSKTWYRCQSCGMDYSV